MPSNDKPSPTQRLEVRKQIQECRVCAWLVGLDARTRAGWVEAIANVRFSASAVAAEMRVDGADVTENSVENHRRRFHQVAR